MARTGVDAWCGRCGQAFDLVQLVAPGAAGDCPRCGERLAGEYATPAVLAVRRLLDAVGAIEESGATLRAVAPHLHVDPTALEAALRRVLDGSA